MTLKLCTFGVLGLSSSGGGPAEGERPNFERTHENFEHTPHLHTTPHTPHHTTPHQHHTHNTTQHNTTQQRHTTQHNGGSRTLWSWARGVLRREVHGPKKQDMSNKLSRRAALLAKVFWGQGWFVKVWAQNGLIQKKGAKRRAKSGAAKLGQKNKKNMEKQIKKTKISFPFTKTKNEKTRNRKKSPKSENISPPLPDQKIKKSKNQHQNQKLENAKRKKIKSKHRQTRKNYKKKWKIKKKSFAFF